MARRQRRLLGFKASVLSLAVPSIASSAPGFVRPSTPGCVHNGPLLTYYFDDGGSQAWSPEAKANFETGASRWRSLRGLSGPSNVLFDVRRVPDGGPGMVRVRLDTPPNPNTPGGTETGSTDCSTSPITIKINQTATGSWLQYLAAHEIGHEWGLRHTGTHDNLTAPTALLDSGTTPVMSGCVPSVTAVPQVDDFANVWHKTSGPSVVADGGFESATSTAAWAKGGTATRDNSVYPVQGSYAMRIAANSWVGQRVRITGAAPTVRAKVSYKANAGPTNFKARVRTVGYLDYPCLTQSVPTSSWFVLFNGPLQPVSLTWRQLQVYAGSPAWASAHAIDVEVIASNTSADQVLWVDNVAMENY